MTTISKVLLAARNNALWCNEVCLAHGNKTEFNTWIWHCLGEPPRFHSSATTLHPDAGEAIRPLAPLGFKDGFCNIDGTELGCRELFSAHWIWQEPALEGSVALEWCRMQTDSELAEWEAGWAHGDAEATTAPRQFPPSLLDNPSNCFAGGFRNGGLAAGCILNFTAPVVGLSNAFSLDPTIDLWAELAHLNARFFPGHPVVGYERGDDLVRATRVGFEAIGELRVWVPV